MDDIDAMFTDLLGEMDILTQSIESEVETPDACSAQRDVIQSIGFSDLNESLYQLEDRDLDKLVADLGSELAAAEERITSDRPTKVGDEPIPPPSAPGPALAPAPGTPKAEAEAQAKADKIKLALEKLSEAKIKKLVVKVLMEDSSSKTLMVDGRQTVREVLDNLFEKTHCDCSPDWSLCETNPDLQTERGFEDHENLVEPLSSWTRDSSNTLLFLRRPSKYALFREPQEFYLWRKDQKLLDNIKDRDKELLLKENFEGASLMVPDLEGVLYLKEDDKKSWKRRYFLLRASGIYYVPKGKTKTSTDLACFIQFDRVNVYTTSNYRQRYKAPTDHCFILKHPQIQRESPYIRFLCCDDERSLQLWVNSIRVAKYGTTLYESYQAALKRASSVSSTFNLTSLSGVPPSTQHRAPPTAQDNNQPEPPPDFPPPPPPAWSPEDV